MLSECFLYGDALKLCFTLGFFALNSVVLCKVLDILRVIVRVIGLRFRGVVELLLSKSHEGVCKTLQTRDTIRTFVVKEELCRHK